MHWEQRLRSLSAAQDGVVGLDQMATIGLDHHHWWRARRSRDWEALTRRVLMLNGAAHNDRTRVLAALFDAGGGALLHGTASLAWFGIRGFNLQEIHATRVRGVFRRPCSLATVHVLRDIHEVDRCVVRGVPTVSPIRAVWSEASRFSSPELFERGVARVGRLLDDAHRAGLITWHQLHDSVRRLGKRGRAGTTIMRQLATDRLPGTSPTESRLEDQFEAVMARFGFAGFRRQVQVGGAEPIGRVDFGHAELPLTVEVNSLKFHSTPSDQAADEERYILMAGAGFAVVVIWEDDLWSNSTSVRLAVKTGLQHAKAGRPGAIHSASCPWPPDPDRLVVGNHRLPHRG